MNISNFNNGDLIVRTEPGKYTCPKYNENLGVSVDIVTGIDTSYIGVPFKLLDVANGIIYVEVIGRPVCNGSKVKEMKIVVFGDGWGYFTVPNGLTIEYFNNKLV